MKKVIYSLVIVLMFSCYSNQEDLKSDPNDCIVSYQDTTASFIVDVKYDTCSSSIQMRDSIGRILRNGVIEDDKFKGFTYSYYPNSNIKSKKSCYKNQVSGLRLFYFENDSGKVQFERLDVMSFGKNHTDKKIEYDVNGNVINEYRPIAVFFEKENIKFEDSIQVKILPLEIKNLPNFNVSLREGPWLYGDKDSEINYLPIEYLGDTISFKVKAEKRGLNYLSGFLYNSETKGDSEYGLEYYFCEEFNTVD